VFAFAVFLIVRRIIRESVDHKSADDSGVFVVPSNPYECINNLLGLSVGDGSNSLYAFFNPDQVVRFHTLVLGFTQFNRSRKECEGPRPATSLTRPTPPRLPFDSSRRFRHPFPVRAWPMW